MSEKGPQSADTTPKSGGLSTKAQMSLLALTMLAGGCAASVKSVTQEAPKVEEPTNPQAMAEEKIPCSEQPTSVEMAQAQVDESKGRIAEIKAELKALEAKKRDGRDFNETDQVMLAVFNKLLQENMDELRLLEQALRANVKLQEVMGGPSRPCDKPESIFPGNEDGSMDDLLLED